MDTKKLEQFNELHLAFIEMSRKINEVIEEEDIDISREQLGVFKLLLEHKKLTMKEIAESQGVFKTAISKRVKKLEDKGYISKVSSTDAREKVIKLTEKGHQFYENRQNILYKGLEKKLNLNDDELQQLFSHVKAINSIFIKGENNG